jgi:beta-phosphoglucomutase-like phosphatase (HAD superfamily)
MKLAIFDFDGTLVDSRKLIIESHRIIFAEFGFSPPRQDESLALKDARRLAKAGIVSI